MSLALHTRLFALTIGVVTIGALSVAPAVAGEGAGQKTQRAGAGGTIDGFATGDFLYVDALDTSAGDLAQVSVSQSAAAVSNQQLPRTDALGQRVYDGNLGGKNAYGHASGVSLNLGQGDDAVPQARLTTAEAASPPRQKATTNLVQVPAAPLLDATVQPSTAVANTKFYDDFCVLGEPISQGVADVADAQIAPADAVAPGFALLDATGEVLDRSTQQLVPNGHGTFGLSSSSTLETAGVTLFAGIAGAETTIKVLNPITLEAIAGGFPGTASVTFGDTNGDTPVLSIKSGTNTAILTLHDLVGNGATIDFNGLIQVAIGLHPATEASPDGTQATGLADLVRITVIGDPAASTGNVGGPLGGVLDPVLGPVFDALDNSGLLQQVDQALADAGLTKGVDFRLGHFEVSAEVPQGGISCGLPVRKTVDDETVHPGDRFTYTITVHNPYTCTLTDVRVEDAIAASSGVLWNVVSTRPAADQVSDNRVVWKDIGDIRSGESRSVDVTVVIDDASTSGRFTDRADATAACGTGSATGSGRVTLTGRDVLHEPQVTLVAARPQPATLPHTGMSQWLALLGVLLLGVGLLARRLVIGRE